MAPGHQTCASSPSYVPSVKLVTWTLVTGALLVSGALHEVRPPQPSTGQALSAPASPAVAPTAPAAATGPAVEPLRPAPPLRLRIPVIGVDAPMSSLDLDASGALQPPPADNPRLVGWYGGGTSPGSVGTAVTTGHVDLPTGGPGVFYGLGSVAKGNTIEIDREDDRTAVFTVDAVEIYDKERFPSDKVYGSSDRAELRVITCGGDYTKGIGYRSNVVVYASLAAVR
ncbi:class F sortase [Streptomyces bobili]|uniref:class F sortase n=1 Tax=Streptomyces bobili TaxID=67280 RepID=UPI003F54095B